MNFPSIDIQGSIISSELLGKIRSEQATFQQGKDFRHDYTTAKLKDEISSAWQDAKGQWTIFQNKLNRLNAGDTATTETRNFWMVPLLSNLGYNLNFNRQSEEINGKSFPISYRDSQLDGFPVYIAGYNESLDKRPENRQLRVSPHAMVQEYLNYSEHLYGIVTNGKQLRLLRDASRITRLSYLEFNLQKMMEEDLYSDFVLLYRLLHSSRMPQKMDGGAESIMEKYHQEGLEAGSTIRDKLGKAVKDSILDLARGFINHPDNGALRQIMATCQPDDAADYYHHQLRIIYRLLFLFVIEERNLVYADSRTPETKRFNHIYFNYYSLLRLRKMAKKLLPPEADRHYDLWQSLLGTFALFEDKTVGEKLGIMSLQGDLFNATAIANRAYDLHDCRLSNEVLLKVLRALGYFENGNGVLTAVNYGGLDVEEFGSVYEGLLELKLKIEPIVGSDRYSCTFDTSNERSKSGSHYTPEELVQPLIKHSLDYLLEDRKKIITDHIARQKLTGANFRSQREELLKQHIYTLKVCDIACGSGHLLISGARRIAEVAACIVEEEEQPNPKAFQTAKRNAILNCIYGVDKNPLAVELCKIALWLEAYVPGQPLNFLDHHIKCGDAIVGLAHRSELENGIADEAFKTLPGDDKDVAKIFRDQNSKERKISAAKSLDYKVEFEKTTVNSVHETMAEYKTFNRLPETTPDEIEQKARAYRRFIDGKGFSFLKAMADTQVAQFFVPKNVANKDLLMTDAEFRRILTGHQGWQDRKVAKAQSVALPNRFFHWFLEFPEVFNEGGGFDCVLGNPPYIAARDMKDKVGECSQLFIKSNYLPNFNKSDIVAFFFVRDFSILNTIGFISLIATNTISQGDTRKTSLEVIVDNNGIINFAKKSIPWPGKANTTVSLISINKGFSHLKATLDSKSVNIISANLEGSDTPTLRAIPLYKNKNITSIGSQLTGEGFKLSAEDANNYVLKSNKNSEVLFPFLTGDDINSNFNIESNVWVIDFMNLDISESEKYKELFSLIELKVKTERENGNDERGRKIWWQHLRNRIDIYTRIRKKQYTIINAVVSKYPILIRYSPFTVFSNKITIFDIDNIQETILYSSLYHEWVYKQSTTMGASTINYGTIECFETFPFPQNLTTSQEQKLEQIGEEYHEFRRQLMLKMQLGLTKTYNAFHAKEIQESRAKNQDLEGLDKKAMEKQYGKEVWNLWNHLQKTENACSFEEAVADIIHLRELHVEMDEAVLEAYGWNLTPSPSPQGEGSKSGISLRHDFYEVDYLPENDRVRYTIHPEARKEILKRLLELNHKIHAEEVEMGLWEKKKTTAKKASKPKPYETKVDLSVLSEPRIEFE
jgi:hypothetical protein